MDFTDLTAAGNGTGQHCTPATTAVMNAPFPWCIMTVVVGAKTGHHDHLWLVHTTMVAAIQIQRIVTFEHDNLPMVLCR
jgi:hypothetical protein